LKVEASLAMKMGVNAQRNNGYAVGEPAEAVENTANDDISHVISYIDLFEPLKRFHGSAGSL
jgi:hypothetical protein